jgi:hypothetical protein
MFEEPAPGLGPVLVTVRYVVEPAKAAEFLHEMYKYQRVRRRDGATRWRIFYDTEDPSAYLESFIVDSWAEHQRQHDRFTVADRDLEMRVLSYTLGSPKVKHYIHAKKTERS